MIRVQGDSHEEDVGWQPLSKRSERSGWSTVGRVGLAPPFPIVAPTPSIREQVEEAA